MRTSTCISLTLVLLAAGGVRTANAQSAAAHRLRISINAGAQPSSITFAGSTTKVVYQEHSVVNTKYGVGTGRSFDGGVLVGVIGRISAGVAVSTVVKRQDGAFAVTVPHPFFTNTPRSIAGTASGLERNELVTHIQGAYVMSSGGKVDIVLSGGPSWFHVKQDLVSDVTVAETFPYNTVAFVAASSTTISTTKIGFNAGADVGVRLSRNVGVGGLVRFSRASVEFQSADDATAVTSRFGGIQLAVGLRLFF